MIFAPVAAEPKGLLRRLPTRLRALVLAPIALVGALSIGMAGMMVYYTVAIPDPHALQHKERGASVRILARDGTTLAQRGGAPDFIPLELVPRLVIDAVVATEDRRFNEHWGLDPIGLVRAAMANLRAGRFAQGGSTLTQQLAKNLFLTPERTMARKLEEVVLAFWLEMRLSKSEILELYLNRVYFGGGAYGIEAAAQRFFGKSARELTIAEAAVIAGALKAPSRYSPTANPAAARARGRSVLAKMREADVITADEEQKARAETVRFVAARPAADRSWAEYPVDVALERLQTLLPKEIEDDIVIETTIDAELQKRASAIVAKELATQGTQLSASQAAAVVLDIDGGIRALVGGRSYAESQFNRAVKARRQPGSAFKPFVYLAALEAGYTPDSVAHDLPLSISGWSPQNENGKHVGAVTLARALAQSINTVAVRLNIDVGPKRAADVARRLGIVSPLREDPSLALGTSEVSLLELTGAYTAFANGGRVVEPHAIRRVRLASGRILYARSASATDHVIEPRNVSAMNGMLREVMQSGTGRRAAITGHRSAGKTGTSQDYRDAWFIGFTAHLTAGIWVGNDNGATMAKVRGGQLPADIWRQIMEIAHAGLAPEPLPGDAPTEQAPVSELPAPPPPAMSLEAATAASRLHSRDLASGPRGIARGHPAESIGEDFIARVVDGTSEVAAAAPDAAHASEGVLGEDGRIIVRPPSGIMSLGVAGRSGDRPIVAGHDSHADIEDCGVWRYLTGC